MKVVISLGGSVLSPENASYIPEVANLIIRVSQEHDLYIVVGGGKTARHYITAARVFCTDEQYLDTIGIAATRLNALLINAFFKKPIPETIEAAAAMQPPVIMGGTVPGHSTDAVAAMLARRMRADRLVIATDVDGIYERDPKRYPGAKKLDSIHIRELRAMAGDTWKKAGMNAVIDGIACRIIDEEKISTCVVNGKDVKMLENAIYGEEFNGTVVEV